MTRRAAIVLVIAFVAGPAMNWKCLFSCPVATAVVATETCHGGKGESPLLSTGVACGTELAPASPFVSTASAGSPLLTSIANTLVIPLTTAAPQPAVFVDSHADPPDTRTLVPLRI